MTNNERYNNGKIYKLVNDVDEEIYVGSTCLSLSKRLSQHKHSAANKTTYKVYQHLNNIGWDNVHIILVEVYPCKSKIELVARERYWYDIIKPKLNTQIPARSKQEYVHDNFSKIRDYKHQHYEENRDHYEEYHKVYYDNNKVSQLRRQTEIIECNICKCYIQRNNLPRHNKTKRHLMVVTSVAVD